MINLLPTDQKSNIVYARRNTLLWRWALTGLVFILGIGLLIAFGHFYIGKSINLLSKDVEATRKQSEVQRLEDTQKRVEEISSQTKLVVQVLSREVLFSKVLKQIGSVMPQDTSLTKLTISKVGGGLDLEAAAIDQRAATQIQVNLQDSNNKLFEKVDINSIDCKDDASRQYPCQVTLRALFGSNSPFLFITNDPAVQGSRP
jgi:hypothetical protein